MIPAKKEKQDSDSHLHEDSLTKILAWFEQHRQSLYSIARCYLTDEQQIEELFYQCILKVDKESSRFKKETSYEAWITSIFIHNCQEFSGERNLPISEETQQDLYTALKGLKKGEKEAILLTYLKGLSYDETASLLQLEVNKLKALLTAGIRSIRNQTKNGNDFKGCKEYDSHYLDYFNRTMERSKKIDFEIHLYDCRDCQEDLATFQDVMIMLDRLPNQDMPAGLMEKIRARIEETEKHRQQKRQRRRKIGLITASTFTVLIALGFITGIFSTIYYTVAEEDPELRYYLKENMGERLNLTAEDKGIKITIKSVIADEFQTLVYYEIEDTKEDNQYMMTYDDGVFVEEEFKKMSGNGYPHTYPPELEKDINKEEKNIYHGKLSLRPILDDEENIHLKINKIHKIAIDEFKTEGYIDFGITEYKMGDWDFEIPITKQPSIEYTLDHQTEVEGIRVRFDRFVSAPTSTLLEYSMMTGYSEQSVYAISIEKLEMGDQTLETDMYGGFYNTTGNMDGSQSIQIMLEPLLGDRSNEMSVYFDSMQSMVYDPMSIPLDASIEYPQTFEYAGSTISIDKVDIGNPTEITFSNYETKNRIYDNIQYTILTDSNMASMEMDADGVVIDRDGVEHDLNDPSAYYGLKQPRYVITEESVRLMGDHIIPKALEINGYNRTQYLDDVVNITLNPSE